MAQAYIGPFGGMVGFECPSSEGTDPQRPEVSRTTIGGDTKVKRAPRGKRLWQVGLGVARPSEIASLLAMAEFGTPPYRWVGPWAQVTNALTARQSVLLDGVAARDGATHTPGGAVKLADGTWAVRSLAISGVYGDTRVGHITPVVPGVPVTASVYLRALGAVGARMRIVWVDSAGGDTGAQLDSLFAGSQTAMHRFHVTATPPPVAAGLSIRVENANQVANPAVTYSSELLDWHTGHGGESCTASIPSEAAILATNKRDSSGQLTSLAMTVQEL